ncbi:MAG TPA: hypothetical protein PKG98_06350 [Myxococcota bacterium]|nr:hypothetical protein [Myxococcota bacterium]
MNQRARIAICLALIAAAATAAYLPVFSNTFAWDDEYLVLKNPAITRLSSIPGFFSGSWAEGVDYKLGQEQNRPYFRPMALTSMTVDWAIAGPDRVVFHTTNLLIHIAAAFFLFLWLRSVFSRTPSGEGTDRSALIAAFIGALLWAVHPVSTEAVNLVSYRTSLISGMTVFASLWLLTPAGSDARSPRWTSILGGTFMFAVGMLSKETTLVMPGLLFLMDLAARRLNLRRIMTVYLPLGLVGLIWLAARTQFTGQGVYTWFEGLTLAQSVLMFGRIFYLYVRLVLLPWPLCPFYDWGIMGVPRSFFEPDIAAGFFLFAIILLSAIFLFRRRPITASGLAFFLLGLLPVSHIIPFFDAAGERFLYVPLAGAIIAAAGAFIESPRRERLARPAIIAAGVIVLAFGALTFVRSTQWESSETMLRVTTRDFPSSVSAQLGLARLLLEKHRPAEALAPLSEVTELAPNLAIGHALTAVAQARTGDIHAARSTLRRSPFPEARQPSAVELTRMELLKAGELELAERIGLMSP